MTPDDTGGEKSENGVSWRWYISLPQYSSNTPYSDMNEHQMSQQAVIPMKRKSENSPKYIILWNNMPINQKILKLANLVKYYVKHWISYFWRVVADTI